MRPPREAYIRVSYRTARTEVQDDGVNLTLRTGSVLQFDMGLEWREGDDMELCRRKMRDIAHDMTQASLPTDTDMEIARDVADRMAATWPRRAYFVELGDADDSWVQVFQPYERD